MLYQALMLQRMWGGNEAACNLPPDLEAMAKQVRAQAQAAVRDLAAAYALQLCQKTELRSPAKPCRPAAACLHAGCNG